ncbi:hypothetical protein ACKC9G_01100 [Pokkaliibacter sp. CJK22405]|uniref:hypothetical protein n=1 Tax=Pokkaliibacter sp. CJK22405 TaxID=3384615 RepID=UPI003984DBCD
MNLSFSESAICQQMARMGEARRARNAKLFDEAMSNVRETLHHIQHSEPDLYSTYARVLEQKFEHH